MRLFSLVLAASLALVGCGPAGPVKLGFLATLSGRASDLGEAARNGVLLAVEQRNAAGGVGGRQIELIVRDDGNSAETIVREVGAFAASGVVAIIGPITSTLAAAALPELEKTRIVMVSPTVTAMQLAGKDDYLFRVNATTRDYARMYADHLYRGVGLRRLAIAQDMGNRAFTTSWLDEFRPVFSTLGGDIAAVVPFESGPTVLFADIVDQLLKAGPDGILFAAGTVDVVRLAQQVKRRAPALPMIAVEWAASEKLYELGGADVEGLRVVESYDRDDSSERYAKFVAEYRQRFRQVPGYTSVAGYDAATVLLDSLSRRSRDQSVKDALMALGSFDGLQQPIRFDRFGDTTRKGYFRIVREGRLAPDE